MLGESFATLAEPLYQEVSRGSAINRSVFTAGGAAGIAFERDNGRLRIEVEGRGRDDVTAGLNQSLPEEFAANFNWAAADGWSALFNVWRDFSVSEKVDLYLGGGVGGGGYRYSMAGSVAFPGEETVLSYTGNAQVASFAWQAGGGVIWNLSDRVAFDVGYRFFSIDQSPTTLTGFIDGVPLGSIVLPQQFTASELLFGLRIYEPFRRWR
jgi:opacity protein-like surface antigen